MRKNIHTFRAYVAIVTCIIVIASDVDARRGGRGFGGGSRGLSCGRTSFAGGRSFAGRGAGTAAAIGGATAGRSMNRMGSTTSAGMNVWRSRAATQQASDLRGFGRNRDTQINRRWSSRQTQPSQRRFNRRFDQGRPGRFDRGNFQQRSNRANKIRNDFKSANKRLDPNRSVGKDRRFDSFRSKDRLNHQRNFLNRNYKGHSWDWWWRYRPGVFFSLFPLYYYSNYGYYPPIYYDYYEDYGYYPTDTRYLEGTDYLTGGYLTGTESTQPNEECLTSCTKECLNSSDSSIGSCIEQCNNACNNTTESDTEPEMTTTYITI